VGVAEDVDGPAGRVDVRPDLVVGPGFPVLDRTVPLVQPASITAVSAAVTRAEPRRVGRMTPVCHRSYLPRRRSRSRAGQEAAGLPDGIGSFRQERPEHLKNVRVGCVSLHPHVHARVPGVPGQRLGFRSRPVTAGVLDEQGRKPGQVSEQRAQARVFERVPGDVGLAPAVRAAAALA
jgi:hypothetical protein